MMRNSIKITGITPEDKLPKAIKGQSILYSDTENIHIPNYKPAAKSIFEISIGISLDSNKVITTNLGKIMIVDGTRKFKIIYTEKENGEKVNFIDLQIPYNTYIELSKGRNDIDKIDVYIVDAYFDLIDSRTIYAYTLYLIDVSYTPFDYMRELEKNKKESISQFITFESEENTDELSIGKTILSKKSGYSHVLDEENKDEINDDLIDLDAEYL